MRTEARHTWFVNIMSKICTFRLDLFTVGREEGKYSTIRTLGNRHLPVFPSARKQDNFLKFYRFQHLSKLSLPPWTWWRNLVPKSLRESWWLSPSITTLPSVTLRYQFSD